MSSLHELVEINNIFAVNEIVSTLPPDGELLKLSMRLGHVTLTGILLDYLIPEIEYFDGVTNTYIIEIAAMKIPDRVNELALLNSTCAKLLVSKEMVSNYDEIMTFCISNAYNDSNSENYNLLRKCLHFSEPHEHHVLDCIRYSRLDLLILLLCFYTEEINFIPEITDRNIYKIVLMDEIFQGVQFDINRYSLDNPVIVDLINSPTVDFDDEFIQKVITEGNVDLYEELCPYIDLERSDIKQIIKQHNLNIFRVAMKCFKAQEGDVEKLLMASIKRNLIYFVAEILSNHSVEITEKMLVKAAWTGNEDLFNLISDPQTQITPEILSNACFSGNDNLVNNIKQGNFDSDCLFRATMSGNNALVNMILSEYTPTEQDSRSLIVASYAGYTEIVRKLASKIKLPTECMTQACMNGKRETLSLLFKLGLTPKIDHLLLSIENEQPEIVELLLDSLDPASKNQKALRMSLHSKSRDIPILLLDDERCEMDTELLSEMKNSPHFDFLRNHPKIKSYMMEIEGDSSRFEL